MLWLSLVLLVEHALLGIPVRLVPNSQLTLQPSSPFLCFSWAENYFESPSVLRLTPLRLNGTIKTLFFFYPEFHPFMVPNTTITEKDHRSSLCRKLKSFGGKSKMMWNSEKIVAAGKGGKPAALPGWWMGCQCIRCSLGCWCANTLTSSDICMSAFPHGFLQSYSPNLCPSADFQPLLL